MMYVGGHHKPNQMRGVLIELKGARRTDGVHCSGAALHMTSVKAVLQLCYS